MSKNINLCFYTLFTFLYLLALIIVNNCYLITLLIIMYLFYSIYKKILIQKYIKIADIFLTTIGVIIVMFISGNKFIAVGIFLKLIMVISLIRYYVVSFTWIEVFYALDNILAVMSYIGLKSTKLACSMAIVFRNMKIKYKYYKNYLKNCLLVPTYSQNSTIYDKIDTVRLVLKIAKRSSLRKIKELDMIMYVKLFRSDKVRTNYYATKWDKYDFIILFILIFIVVSGVII